MEIEPCNQLSGFAYESLALRANLNPKNMTHYVPIFAATSYEFVPKRSDGRQLIKYTSVSFHFCSERRFLRWKQIAPSRVYLGFETFDRLQAT